MRQRALFGVASGNGAALAPGVRPKPSSHCSEQHKSRRERTGLCAPALTGFAASAAMFLSLLAWAPASSADKSVADQSPNIRHYTDSSRVTEIVIDEVQSPAFDGEEYGDVGQYETIEGRAFGVLDPDDPLNEIIQDIELAPRNADGMVEYMATFFLVKPIDMSRSSGLMWHYVPNRGGRITLPAQNREMGEIGLSSGWQGDNSGGTAQVPGREWVRVPIATNPDGSPITGQILGRIINPEGVASSQIFIHSNPVPYQPMTLDTTQTSLTIIESETRTGETGVTREVPSDQWAWANCSEDNPFPGTPDPTQICVDGGFEPNRVYQVVFTAQDPPVLGIGFAAFRDVGSFFKYELEDDHGNPNPLGDSIKWILARGSSQSGTMLRQFLHLGFNQDTTGRQVQNGTWPWVATRRIGLNFRFAVPDGVMKLYEPGAEGPLWWRRWPDRARDLPTRGILDRCRKTHTCPKIIEHAGATEVWGQRMSLAWVGTDPKTDIPLPPNVRRYYIPSTDHGGGDGSFSLEVPDIPSCPSVGYGMAVLPDNPVPHTETRNALEYHFRNWLMHDIPPPPSVWPRLRGPDPTLVEATKEALGFPTLPGLPPDLPSDFIVPVLDYDFGPDFNYSDTTGIRTVVPPVVKQVLPTLAARVDEDGNELGGVPVVLRDAPLATYLGWNIVADGFHEGQICGYRGGMIPFAKTKEERLANGDPRLSLEERYGDHAGYVKAVREAAANAIAQGFLLPDDAEDLIARAEAATEGWPTGNAGKGDRHRPPRHRHTGS